MHCLGRGQGRQLPAAPIFPTKSHQRPARSGVPRTPTWPTPCSRRTRSIRHHPPPSPAAIPPPIRCAPSQVSFPFDLPRLPSQLTREQVLYRAKIDENDSSKLRQFEVLLP